MSRVRTNRWVFIEFSYELSESKLRSFQLANMHFHCLVQAGSILFFFIMNSHPGIQCSCCLLFNHNDIRISRLLAPYPLIPLFMVWLECIEKLSTVTRIKDCLMHLLRVGVSKIYARLLVFYSMICFRSFTSDFNLSWKHTQSSEKYINTDYGEDKWNFNSCFPWPWKNYHLVNY